MQIRRRMRRFKGIAREKHFMKISPISFLYALAIGLCFLAAFCT